MKYSIGSIIYIQTAPNSQRLLAAASKYENGQHERPQSQNTSSTPNGELQYRL